MGNDHAVIHILVSPYAWEGTAIHYRRRRLAEYLLKQSSTQKVVWVYPGEKLSHIVAHELADGILVVAAPRLPWKLQHISYFSHPFHSKLVKYLSNFLAKYPSAKKVLWYTFPAFPGLIDIRLWDSVVYDCSDNWGKPWTSRSFLESVQDRFYLKILQIAEDYVFNNSVCVFATSDFLYKKAVSKTSKPVFLIENGVEFDKFYNSLPGHNFEAFPRPRLGYVGGMEERIGFSLLRELAVKHRNWSLILIGPVPSNCSIPENLRLLMKEENVRWIPGIHPDEVPAHMKELDVGLMPYRDLEFNKGVLALKFFEYLACGLPVVGSGLPSTEKYAADKIYIHTRSDPDQFAAACEKALQWSKDEDARLTRINLAREADWQRKFDFMIATISANISKP